jgi:hypothetical protein
MYVPPLNLFSYVVSSIWLHTAEKARNKVEEGKFVPGIEGLVRGWTLALIGAQTTRQMSKRDEKVATRRGQVTHHMSITSRFSISYSRLFSISYFDGDSGVTLSEVFKLQDVTC